MADKTTPPTVQEGWENNLWITTKGLEIPLDIEPPIEALQSFLELVNNILDFSLFLLDFIKAFIRNFLNPLLSIIKKIITLLKGLLSDLRQLGFISPLTFGCLTTMTNSWVDTPPLKEE